MSASSPSAYRADVSGELREILESVRSLIFEVAPTVHEGVKYGMLHYSLNGVTLASLAAQKHYVSLYLDPQVLDQYRVSLAKLSVGKSCLRYRQLSQLEPERLRKILKTAVQHITAKPGVLEGDRGFNTSENTVSPERGERY